MTFLKIDYKPVTKMLSTLDFEMYIYNFTLKQYFRVNFKILYYTYKELVLLNNITV